MCTSLSAVALAKVGPRFSLTGSFVSFCGPKDQQDPINCESYTIDMVDRSIGSGLAGLGEESRYSKQFCAVRRRLIPGMNLH